MKSPAYYNVAPRYTCGSPAMVDEGTALRVAKEEQRAYEHALTGAYGEEDLATAKRKGLLGIVEMCQERRGGWDVVDVITGRRFCREPVVARKLHAGYRVTRVLSGDNQGVEVPFTIASVVNASGARVWLNKGGAEVVGFDRNAMVMVERDLSEQE